MSLSFVITGGDSAQHVSRSERLRRAFAAGLDRFNSAALIAQARRVYWQFISGGGSMTTPPLGVILQGNTGRVVFCWPTLLPDELFVPADWLTAQGSSSGRAMRSRSRSQPPCTNP